MMEPCKGFEDKLREAACFGDEEAVCKLVEKGVNVNSQHEINGWTAMHWAAKRGHANIVSYLINHGADRNIPTKKGELASSLTDNDEICKLLGGAHTNKSEEKLPIVPNYIAYPPLTYKVDINSSTSPLTKTSSMMNGILGSPNVPSSSSSSILKDLPTISTFRQSTTDELVLKVRIAHTSDPDFIEVELPVHDLSYSRLARVCSEELGIDPGHILKIRKLPDTILRKDKDIHRLQNFQELELVMSNQKCYDSKYSISPFTQHNANPNAGTKPSFTNCKILY